jgi:hypothetical protein
VACRAAARGATAGECPSGDLYRATDRSLLAESRGVGRSTPSDCGPGLGPQARSTLPGRNLPSAALTNSPPLHARATGSREQRVRLVEMRQCLPLVAEPGVVKPPTVENTVDHYCDTVHPRVAAGAQPVLVDDRSGGVFLQLPVDFPDQFLALLLVRFD